MPRSNSKKLLAINFGGIGDEILFLPTLASIRSEHPDWHISLLLEPRSQSIAEVTNLIDATIAFDIKKRPLLMGDLMDLLGIIRNGGFDMVLSSGSSPLVAILLFSSGIRIRVGYDSGPLSRALLTQAVTLNQKQYAGCMYHDLSAGLGISRVPQLPQVVVADANRKQMLDFLESSTARLQHGSKASKRVLIHPGTSKLAIQKGIIKTWPSNSWAQLIGRLSQHRDIQVVLAGGPDDAEIVMEITRALQSAQMPFVSALGITKGLADLAALIDLSDLLVCVDSAPMHLAVGLKKNLVALFGPTKSERLLPPDARFVALRQDIPGSGQVSSLDIQPELPAGGVKIPLELVYQTIVDHLSIVSNQESFLESPH